MVYGIVQSFAPCCYAADSCNKEGGNNHSCRITRGVCELVLQEVDIADSSEMRMQGWNVEDVSWIERRKGKVTIWVSPVMAMRASE